MMKKNILIKNGVVVDPIFKPRNSVMFISKAEE